MAYLAARQGVKAVIEFQKILDHRAIVASDPVGALAHLQDRQSICVIGRSGQSEDCSPGFLHPVERRR
jgi:hypothetical protein